jgi:hypothetical protein
MISFHCALSDFNVKENLNKLKKNLKFEAFSCDLPPWLGFLMGGRSLEGIQELVKSLQRIPAFKD